MTSHTSLTRTKRQNFCDTRNYGVVLYNIPYPFFKQSNVCVLDEFYFLKPNNFTYNILRKKNFFHKKKKKKSNLLQHNKHGIVFKTFASV